MLRLGSDHSPLKKLNQSCDISDLTAISNKTKRQTFLIISLQHLFLTTYYDLPSDDEITYCLFFVYLTNHQTIMHFLVKS